MDNPITTPSTPEAITQVDNPGVTVTDNPAGETLELSQEELEKALDASNPNLETNNSEDPEGKTDKAAEDKPVDTSKEEVLKTDITKHNELTKALEKDLKKKGFDVSRALKEYEETGNISSRTLADLAAAGYPKEVIEGIISNQRALEDRFVQAVYETAGGEEEFTKVIRWASNNLPKATVDSFNNAVDSNDLGLISLLIQGIKSKMVETRGTSNPTIMGASGETTRSSRGFASKDDIVKAMSDPRYARDPAYTRSVEQKMLYTNF